MDLNHWRRWWSFFLDQSLFVKVGFVLTFCGVIIFLIIGVLLHVSRSLEKNFLRIQEARTIVIFSWYQRVHLLKDSKNLTSYKELHDITETLLNGGVVSLTKEQKISISPEKDPQARQILRKILNYFQKHPKGNIPQEIFSLSEKLVKLNLQRDEEYRKKVLEIIDKTRWIESLLLILLVMVLISCAISFFIMVLQPLRKITVKLRKLREAGRRAYEEHLLVFPYKDEIGSLVEETNRLILQFAELAYFKHIIEEDDALEEVYQRLARIFKERFNLENFAFLAVSNSQNTIEPVFTNGEQVSINPEILVDANRCRAKRTGHSVSSLDFPGICPLEEADHVCIPLVTGGKVQMVIKLLPSIENEKDKQRFVSDLKFLRAYLEEAQAVIEAKRYAASLKEMAIKDPLTGLWNRRFVEEGLETIAASILRRGTILGVLMCDVDHFKQINDNYGHDIGDELLHQIAEILKNKVRKSDIVARFGGEEFLILLQDTKEGQAEVIAEKLREAIEKARFQTKAGTIRRTISIGVSEFPIDDEDIWQTVKFADVALYRAKEKGRNRVVRFTPEMWDEGKVTY